MRTSGFIGVLAAVLGLLGSVVDVAHATEDAAIKMPPHDFGCTLCHAGSGATLESVPASTAATLTSFGDEWLQLAIDEADRLWSTMAGGNADGDGCSNGCELDDPRGIYLPDAEFQPESCAPGDPRESDCALPINEQSWGTLKSLFDEN